MEFGKEYIKLFETEAEYLAFTASTEYILPNVSHIKQSDNTHYVPLITIADAVITCNSVTYNGEAQSATISVALSGNTLVKDTDYTISGTTSGTNAGDYSFTINGIGNYKGSKNGTFTINKVTPTVTAPVIISDIIYNATSQALVTAGSTNWGTLKYSLDDSTYSTSIPSGINATNYTIYYKVEGDSNINDVAVQSLSNSIAKVTPTVVAPTAKVLTYNGSAQELVNAGSTDWGTLQYRAGSDSWSTSIPTRTRGGSYTVEYKVVGDSNINDVAAQSVNCSINEKPVTATVTLSQTAYTYNGSACQPTPTVSDGGTVIDPSEYSVTYSNNINAGTGTVTISDNAGGDYEVIGSATFTINKVTPTVTAPTAKSLTYTGSAQALVNAGSTNWGTLKYSLDDSTYSTEIPSGTNATSYTVYYKVDGDSNINSVAAQSVTVTIAKADQAAPGVTGATTTYPTTATATANGGGGQGSIEWESAQSQSSVGSHTTRARWTGNSNYNASPWSSSVTVQMNKANISPTVSISNWTYGGTASNPSVDGNSGSGTVTYYYKLSSASSWSTTKPSNAGSYNIKADIAETTNYNSGTCTSNFTINKASRTISFTTAPTSVTMSSTITVAATPSAGSGDGAITYSSSNTNIATVNGSIVTGKAAGTCTITATIAAGTNYASATTSYILTVSDYRVISKFNVTSTSSPTKIGYNQQISGFSAIEIDGVAQSSVVSAYTFNTTGEHTVKYTLTDPTKIGYCAFKDCSSLISVTIPNDVVSLEGSSFYNCSSLTSVTIPNSVTTIRENAFNGCSGLTSCTIGSGVTTINTYAFYSCKKLTSITIPNSVTTIESNAFGYCSNLTSVIMPNNITKIGGFSGCISLTSIGGIGSGASVEIPNSVTTIGGSAFNYCSGLTSVNIPNSVTSIQIQAFYGCTRLTSITVNATTPPTLQFANAFGNTNDCPIYVPSGSVNAYKAASGWSDLASRIQAIS